MSESNKAEGPGGLWIWLILLVAFVGAGIAIYFLGPWLQDEVNEAPGADAGAPIKEVSGD